jgi:hypothetical protein
MHVSASPRAVVELGKQGVGLYNGFYNRWEGMRKPEMIPKMCLFGREDTILNAHYPSLIWNSLPLCIKSRDYSR